MDGVVNASGKKPDYQITVSGNKVPAFLTTYRSVADAKRGEKLPASSVSKGSAIFEFRNEKRDTRRSNIKAGYILAGIRKYHIDRNSTPAEISADYREMGLSSRDADTLIAISQVAEFSDAAYESKMPHDLGVLGALAYAAHELGSEVMTVMADIEYLSPSITVKQINDFVAEAKRVDGDWNSDFRGRYTKERADAGNKKVKLSFAGVAKVAASKGRTSHSFGELSVDLKSVDYGSLANKLAEVEKALKGIPGITFKSPDLKNASNWYAVDQTAKDLAKAKAEADKIMGIIKAARAGGSVDADLVPIMRSLGTKNAKALMSGNPAHPILAELKKDAFKKFAETVEKSKTNTVALKA